MTREELDKLNIKNDDGVFTPKTVEKIIEKEVDGEIIQIFDYEIIQSAEDYYKEWLNNKNNLPQKEPTKEEVLLKEIANLKVDNMKKDVIATNTLKSLAELKVEIMELKGGNK